MDETDRKILHFLDKDSRMPAKQIARLMGQKSEKINYRLKKLLDTKVLDRCFAEVNPWKIGYTSFKVYIQFQGVDQEKVDEMYNFLTSSCNVNWVASCLGRWDMVIEILASDRHEFKNNYDRFHARYCGYILYKVIGVSLELIFTNKKWLCPEDKDISVSIMTGSPTRMVDDKDMTILRQLIRDCRKPVKRISEETGIPSTTILQRINNMCKKGIITHFRTGIFLENFDRIFCKSFVYFAKPSKEEEDHLIDFLVHHPDVTYLNKTIAPWELEIDAHASSFNDFTEMMKEIAEKFPGVVRNFEAVVINKGTGSFHTLPS